MTAVAPRPMAARRQVRLAVVQDLLALNIAKVFSPGNYPTAPESLPALLVSAPTDAKQSLGKNMPAFSTSITLWVQGQVKAATNEAAQDAIEDLIYQVENAILKGYWTNRIIEQVQSVTTDTEVNADGGPIHGGFRMVLVMQTMESFDPTPVEPPSAAWPPAAPVLTPMQGIGLHADLTNVFSPTGTFPDPAFPDAVNPAPRTAGPDGRDEGALDITLPQ